MYIVFVEFKKIFERCEKKALTYIAMWDFGHIAQP